MAHEGNTNRMAISTATDSKLLIRAGKNASPFLFLVTQSTPATDFFDAD